MRLEAPKLMVSTTSSSRLKFTLRLFYMTAASIKQSPTFDETQAYKIYLHAREPELEET